MMEYFKARARQGRRTVAFPPGSESLPERFRGLPTLNPELCREGCRACEEACPTGAVAAGPLRSLDLGRCMFCPACTEACPTGALSFSREFALASTARERLVLAPGEGPRVEALSATMRRLFGRSLQLRQVSAGGCNGCEAELNALSNVVYDIQRFGIQFAASPRHADGVLVTGPVTLNMARALRLTYEAVPPPKFVILVGACALSGGPFAGNPEVAGVPKEFRVDLYIPGCPPHPLTLLDGLLAWLGRIEKEGRDGKMARERGI